MWAIIVILVVGVIMYDVFTAIETGCLVTFMSLTIFWLVILWLLFKGR